MSLFLLILKALKQSLLPFRAHFVIFEWSDFRMTSKNGFGKCSFIFVY